MADAKAAGHPATSPIFEAADKKSRREIMLPSFDTIIPRCLPCQCIEKPGQNTFSEKNAFPIYSWVVNEVNYGVSINPSIV